MNIIGDTSPQIDKEDSEYIPGAEAGMIFNNGTDKVYNEITVLLYYRRRCDGLREAKDPVLSKYLHTTQFEQMKREGKL